MFLFALSLSTAFAVDILRDTDTQWCAHPRYQTLIATAAPNKKKPERRKKSSWRSDTISATHLKAEDNGSYCLVFTDFQEFMNGTTPADKSVLGVMVLVNDVNRYTQHYAMPVTYDLQTKEPMDVGQYDWKLSKGSPMFFTEDTELLVVSGLQAEDVVKIKLVRMRPDNGAFVCQTREDRSYDCTAGYSSEELIEQRFFGDGVR